MNGAAVLLMALLSAAPKPTGVGAWALGKEPVSLLGGRLTIRLPPFARVEARKDGLMAAAQSSLQETRVVMESGGDKVVLMVDETYSTAPEGLRAEVDIHVGKSREAAAYLVEEVTPADKQLQIVSVRHPAPKKLEDDAVRVVAFYILNPDGLLQVLTFFATTATAADLPACLRLANKAMATLALGTARVDRGGGVRSLQAPFPGQQWRVNVAPDYVVTAQAGPDFLVQRIWRVSSLHASAPMLGIYVGAHPGFHFRRAGAAERVVQETAPMLGVPAIWNRWEMDPPRSTRVMVELQQELASPPDGPKTIMHLWLEGDTPEEIQQLKSMAMSMVLSVPSPSTK